LRIQGDIEEVLFRRPKETERNTYPIRARIMDALPIYFGRGHHFDHQNICKGVGTMLEHLLIIL
jgi:hypothetical protein